MMEGPKAVIGFISGFLILMTLLQSAAAMYSTSNSSCGIRYPGDTTCDGLGTSTPADYGATALNTTTVFCVVFVARVKTVAIIAAASISYNRGIQAILIPNVIIGYLLISATSTASVSYINVLGCPKVTRVTPTSTDPVPGTSKSNNFMVKDLYSMIRLSNTPQTGQCNVVPCSLGTPLPTLAASTEPGPIFDISGLSTVISQDSSGTIKTVTEPTNNSSVSPSCLVNTLSPQVTQAATSVGVSGLALTAGSTGDQLCTVATSLASLFNKIPATVVLVYTIVVLSVVNKVKILINGYSEVFCFYPLVQPFLEVC